MLQSSKNDVLRERKLRGMVAKWASRVGKRRILHTKSINKDVLRNQIATLDRALLRLSFLSSLQSRRNILISQDPFIAPAPRNWFLNDHDRSAIRAEDDIYGQCVIYDFAHFTASVCAKQSVQSSAAADQIAFNKTWIFIVLPRQFHCIVKPGDTLREIYCGD